MKHAIHIFANINGPLGHRTAAYLADGVQVKCACGETFVNRLALGEHLGAIDRATLTGGCHCGFDGTGLDPTTAAYFEAHRDAHLAKYPDLAPDQRASLDLLVALAKRGKFRAPEAVAS